MSPEFNDGDYVLISRIPVLIGRIKIGSVLVFKSVKYGIMIKKVCDLDRYTGTFFFTGTNQQSLSSGKIGAIPEKDIIGAVVYHFKK